MRTQFGRLIQKKSGDGARQWTDREKWVLTNFDFLKTHIVRVSTKAMGLQTKGSHTASSSSTVAPVSDDDSDEEGTPVNDDGPPHEQSSVTDNTPAKAKKKKKSTDADLQTLIDRLSERVQGSQEIREKVAEMVKAVENPHIAYANYLGSMHSSIHPDLLWEEYLKKSHDILLYYLAESKRIRHNRTSEQHQTHLSSYHNVHQGQQGSSYIQLQPVVPLQTQQNPGSSGVQQGLPQQGASSGIWDTVAPTYGSTLLSTPKPGNTSHGSQVSQFSVGSFVRHLDELAPHNISDLERAQESQQEI